MFVQTEAIEVQVDAPNCPIAPWLSNNHPVAALPSFVQLPEATFTHILLAKSKSTPPTIR